MREFVLSYEAVQTAANPDQALLVFLQSTYEAAADLGTWDSAALERLSSVRLTQTGCEILTALHRFSVTLPTPPRKLPLTRSSPAALPERRGRRCSSARPWTRGATPRARSFRASRLGG